MCPASTRSNTPSAMRSRTSGKWQRRIRRSAAWSTRRDGRDCHLRYARGSTPTIWTRTPRTSTSAESSTSRWAGARSLNPAARENGSRLCSTSWFPSPTYVVGPRRSSNVRSGCSRRGREMRSPVTQTRSGSRATVHVTARSTGRRPRGGRPRWKSERCTTRISAGTRASGTSTERRRTQPASNHPHAVAAAPAATDDFASRRAAVTRLRLDARRRLRRGTPRPPRRKPPLRWSVDAGGARILRTGRSDFELLEDRRDRHHVPLELQLRFLEPGCDADELRQVQDRHPEVLAGGRAKLGLPRVERKVAQRARRHDRVGTGVLRLLDWLDQLAERRLLPRLDDREAAALDLRRVVDRLASASLDDPLERPRAVRILAPEDLRRAQNLTTVERRDSQP